MPDAITLDQLRTFIAVVDEGSFSAAGRRLRRVQSAVSHAMANLEAQLGVRIWDRSTKIPTLTPGGKVLLASARRICADVDALQGVAGGLVGGLEASVSLALDAILPVRAVVDMCREFAREFPTVELRLHTETLSSVSALVLDGTCQIGVIGPAAHAQGLEREHFASVQLIPVVAKEHPLAARAGRIPTQVLAEHVNVVLSERGSERQTPDQGVLSPRTWRVADLGTKHALLLGGLGWGNMPEHMVREDIARGRLVRIRPAAWRDDEWNLSLSVVHRPALSKGPATRWILRRLPELCVRETGLGAPGRRRRRRGDARGG
ncbi:LysR family transcriptional regulator [Sorangium cellulosum]|jgi:DNA-binding transcriptional LysR family regulator|uniref:LysR family transcriptional regulator n=1 Tax=Sorangium cellulosum TaxID=56 RepID=A0A4P2QAL8_SORCE|nr:LysR family transcriptional regulator [Sorangium cellulosum]AUX26714.1 LysR family transcriptional regulator [Sorangium cellulosum]